jgi:hypothetical protein
MKSYSQAGQDIWCHRLIPSDSGTFLDIGCGDLQWSNTLALEEIGWIGTLLDIGEGAFQSMTQRPKCLAIKADATKFNWLQIIDKMHVPVFEVDYLSLDVDHASLDALRNLPLDRMKFKVITAEHDYWRFGDELRVPMREIFKKAGYFPVHLDVCGTPGQPFEDWWVSEALVPAIKQSEVDAPNGMYWEDILKL